MALCGIKHIDLKNNIVKIVWVHYYYNKHLENEKNFKNHLQKIETVLKIWRMRILSLEGKFTIFKTLAISKVIHLVSVIVLPKSIITQLNKRHKEFISNHKRPKIKEKTRINNFLGLKNVDIPSKITNLQCSWVKKLFDRNFDKWKIIPLFLNEKYFGKNSNFMDPLILPNTLLEKCQYVTEKSCWTGASFYLTILLYH